MSHVLNCDRLSYSLTNKMIVWELWYGTLSPLYILTSTLSNDKSSNYSLSYSYVYIFVYVFVCKFDTELVLEGGLFLFVNFLMVHELLASLIEIVHMLDVLLSFLRILGSQVTF
jgi:hypothetical protein